MGIDVLFFISLAVEILFVIFFIIKSIFSYEAVLNRCLEKINYWLFEKKNVTEDNIRELNMIFKTKSPKRLCYYWQQYILFREGAPSTYMSVDNLVEKPLKTSSYNSNIKNLTLFTTIWAGIVGMFILVASCFDSVLTGKATIMAMFVPLLIGLIGIIFVVYLRARKNSTLNSLYQNVHLFGRFMDNACTDLPSYIDYQLLFTPQEIEKGQPVLREFLDYKARKEKEEFNRQRLEEFKTEDYDFSVTGVDGSLVLDRAMKESELYLKKKDKVILQISQLEAALDTRRKNFDMTQKEYQTKIQASKENLDNLRKLQEETTNRIQSNYYRKQQTQEIAKQEQLEQEFEQQRAKYLLEKGEGEEEITKLNKELEDYKTQVENAMLSEYQTFFNKFCKSVQSVVTASFNNKLVEMQNEMDKDKQYITQLEIKMKNIPQGELDANTVNEGVYDDKGNYVYPNGTYYDKDGYFHDENGNVYSQDGTLISKQEKRKDDEKLVDFDSFDVFDFMNDTAQKGDIYKVAEDVVKDIDGDMEIINSSKPTDIMEGREVKQPEVKKEEKPEPKSEPEKKDEALVDFSFDELESEIKPEPKKTTPARKAGRPKKPVSEVKKESKPRGRPKKEKKEENTPKRNVGRPRKIILEEQPKGEKRTRGRPKKNDKIKEINKKINEEDEKLNKIRSNLDKDLQSAVNGIENVDANTVERDKLIKEIEDLQNEAQRVMKGKQSADRLEEINKKIESLLKQIENLN